MGGLKALFSRSTREVTAVDDVSFGIEEGAIVGFLGANGAGKTTTIKMLCGILHPSGGECRTLGFDPWRREPALLKQIALVMGNKQQLWWDLPAWDSFLVLRDLYEVEPGVFRQRLDRLVEELELTDKVHTQVRKLSLGERMKCELVAALLHQPRVVFLDEPTIGLDVVSQKRIRTFLADMNREFGSTILLTSHYMQDVKELCPRVIVIDEGRVRYDGRLQRLVDEFSDTRRLRIQFLSDPDWSAIAALGSEVSRDGLSITLDVPRERVTAVSAGLLRGGEIQDIAIEDVSMDDVVRHLFEKRTPNVSRETSGPVEPS